MSCILSDLEGASIRDTIEKISEKNEIPNKIFITGDIIDSTMTNFDINVLKKNKSNNLDNISYCLFTNNLTLILGNRDLNKIKLINALKINVNAPGLTTDQISQFTNFNNGNIIMTRNIYIQYFAGNIPWQYSLMDFFPIWNAGAIKKYKGDLIKESIKNIPEDVKNVEYFDKNSDFISRFKYIFVYTMAAGNLLYSIPYEINDKLEQMENNVPLIDMESIETYLGKNIIDETINKNKEFNHHAFIVCAIFISLLYQPGVYDTADKRYILFSNNSNFCKSMLYKLYIKNSTSMIYLYDEKYLLSHGGITKYCLNIFKNKKNIEDFCSNMRENYGNSDIEIKPSTGSTAQANINLTHADLKAAIDICNSTFKLWIQNSYVSDVNTSLPCLKYISYMTTESNNPQVIEANPYNLTGRQYYSPIGPGFISLTNSDIRYISTTVPIVQIFGHKPFGFANSFYSIDEKNMLICLDVSNSFSTTPLNNNYISYNYIYIKNNILTSTSLVSLKKSGLIMKIYDKFSCDPIKDSILHYSSNYEYSTTGEVITLDISNKITVDQNITYTRYGKVFNILNTLFKKCPNEGKLIYNGFIQDDKDTPFFVFAVINGFYKDFYILSLDDILPLYDKYDDISKKYMEMNTNDLYTILDEYKRNIVQKTPASYRQTQEQKYIKYKTKYLKSLNKNI